MAVMTPPSQQGKGKAADGQGSSLSGSSKTRPKSGFPAPRQLAVPTDLTPDEVQKVAEALNPLIADHFALYVKTKNFHWHLASSHFRDYHLLFDEQADTIFEAIDPMAERLRKIGATTIRSIRHIADLKRVEDDDDDYVTPLEMIRRLHEDNRKAVEACRKAIEVAEDNRDHPTANILEEVLDAAERRAWFLYEILQGAEHAG